jgi:hypothetical protein
MNEDNDIFQTRFNAILARNEARASAAPVEAALSTGGTIANGGLSWLP